MILCNVYIIKSNDIMYYIRHMYYNKYYSIINIDNILTRISIAGNYKQQST